MYNAKDVNGMAALVEFPRTCPAFLAGHPGMAAIRGALEAEARIPAAKEWASETARLLSFTRQEYEGPVGAQRRARIAARARLAGFVEAGMPDDGLQQADAWLEALRPQSAGRSGGEAVGWAGAEEDWSWAGYSPPVRTPEEEAAAKAASTRGAVHFWAEQETHPNHGGISPGSREELHEGQCLGIVVGMEEGAANAQRAVTHLQAQAACLENAVAALRGVLPPGLLRSLEAFRIVQAGAESIRTWAVGKSPRYDYPWGPPPCPEGGEEVLKAFPTPWAALAAAVEDPTPAGMRGVWLWVQIFNLPGRRIWGKDAPEHGFTAAVYTPTWRHPQDVLDMPRK